MARGLEKSPNEHIAPLTALRGIQLDASRSESAEPLLRDGLAMSQRLHPGGDRSVAVALNLAGQPHARLNGRYEQADSLQRSRARHAPATQWGDEPRGAGGPLHFAMVEIDRGRFAPAESLARLVLSVGDRIYTEPHPNQAAGLIALAECTCASGQFARGTRSRAVAGDRPERARRR